MGRIWSFGGRAVFALVLVALFLVVASDNSFADDRPVFKGVALVVGQSRYEHLTTLDNPSRDADAIGQLLERLGFAVTQVADQNSRKLRRTFDDFVGDAADDRADVALVYYSGHGIEADGESYLLPVDADIGSLENATETLVPISRLLHQLQSKAKITIVLLDACRSNPFPAGALIKTQDAPQGVAIAASGLQAPKGMVVIARKEAGENIGTLIGFAADPGKAALDGEPAGNSPYAAALLRHLSALQGMELGQVMRLVTEEVYLKTKRAQRPWVNESLTKFLYFGAPKLEDDSEQSLIDEERRPLLLMIADLPQEQRREVETLADTNGVQLDTLYGVLRALGQSDMPKDAEALDRALKAQAETLKKFTAERQALDSDDPEIVHLVAAADRAIAEGAIKTARSFLDRAKANIEDTRASIEGVEARAKAKRIANAALLEKSAEAATLDVDYMAAARDYAAAFAWVKDADKPLAWQYKLAEAGALSLHGEKGDNGTLYLAIEAYHDALDLAPRAERIDDWAQTQADLGVVLSILGERESSAARLEEAVRAFRAALEERTRERLPLEWAMTQSNLGAALVNLGARESGSARLEEAIAAYRAALEEATRERAPFQWATTQNNLGTALFRLGEYESGTAWLEEAVAAFRAALGERTRERLPLEWAMTQSNLGNSLLALGARESGTARLEEAVAAHLAVLEERTRELVPFRWALSQHNLGNALVKLGEREGGTARLEQAVAAYRAALEEHTQIRAPFNWAMTQADLGTALFRLGEHESGTARIEEAIAAYRAALEEQTRARTPAQWAVTQVNFGNALTALGEREGDTTWLKEAIAAYRAVLEERTRELVPYEWAVTQINLGNALSVLGKLESGTARLEEAVAAYRAALEEMTRPHAPSNWAVTQINLGNALLILGERESGTARLEEAVASFRAALQEWTRDRAPLEWARAQNDLGVALASLGEREKGTQRIEEAVATYREALKERTQERAPLEWAQTQANLRNAIRVLGERNGPLRALDRAERQSKQREGLK